MIFPNAWNLSEDDATTEITPNDSNIESKAIQNDGSSGGPIGGPIGSPIGGLIELTDRQLEVLNLINENNKITKVGIAAKLNINVSAVLKHLQILKQKGVLKRIGGTRGYWQVMFTKTLKK
jgi:predicted HTH transcriptional regulator